MNANSPTAMSFYEWFSNIENLIANAISGCHPRGWDENHISFSWLSAITSSLHNTKVTDIPMPFVVNWDAYKASGTLERDHGDIAILVRLAFTQSNSVSGVGFLEAKRIYPSGEYTALDWPQLKYQSPLTTNHRLLLYDNQHISSAVDNLLAQGFCRQCFPESFTRMLAATIPSQHAIALNRRDRELHNLCLPLSYQICCRYLRGFDLDYTPSLVQAVENGAIPSVKYLLIASIAIGSEPPSISGNPALNREHFRLISADQQGEK